MWWRSPKQTNGKNQSCWWCVDFLTPCFARSALVLAEPWASSQPAFGDLSLLSASHVGCWNETRTYLEVGAQLTCIWTKAPTFETSCFDTFDYQLQMSQMVTVYSTEWCFAFPVTKNTPWRVSIYFQSGYSCETLRTWKNRLGESWRGISGLLKGPVGYVDGACLNTNTYMYPRINIGV